MEECNGLTIGQWKFDVFTTETGSLGFTVYSPSTYKEGEDELNASPLGGGSFVDIFCHDDPAKGLNITTV